MSFKLEDFIVESKCESLMDGLMFKKGEKAILRRQAITEDILNAVGLFLKSSAFNLLTSNGGILKLRD